MPNRQTHLDNALKAAAAVAGELSVVLVQRKGLSRRRLDDWIAMLQTAIDNLKALEED